MRKKREIFVDKFICCYLPRLYHSSLLNVKSGGRWELIPFFLSFFLSFFPSFFLFLCLSFFLSFSLTAHHTCFKLRQRFKSVVTEIIFPFAWKLKTRSMSRHYSVLEGNCQDDATQLKALQNCRLFWTESEASTHLQVFSYRWSSTVTVLVNKRSFFTKVITSLYKPAFKIFTDCETIKQNWDFLELTFNTSMKITVYTQQKLSLALLNVKHSYVLKSGIQWEDFHFTEKILRIMAGTQTRTSCRSLFQQLEVLPVPYQYILSLIIFIINSQEI